MKSFVLAVLTVLSLGVGVANAATAGYNSHQTQDQAASEALGGQGG